ETKEDAEKRKRRNQIIIAFVFISILTSSTIGFVFVFKNPEFDSSENKESIDYNGINFVRNQRGYWQFNSHNSTFFTLFNPKETENISFEGEVNVNDFVNKPLYYSSGNMTAALSELMRNIGSFSLRYQEVCVENYECKNEGLPIKDCSNDIIILKLSDEIKAYKQEKCIFLEGTEEELILLADKLIYKSLGIQ
ncbi:MAG: hypothetical protein QXH60_02590, partial [Candidatus Pacearchaeota archaeon]